LPIAAATPSLMIWCEARAIACNPDEQNRFMVVPATEVRRPASMAEVRAML
jgi:hypothetical protein